MARRDDPQAKLVDIDAERAVLGSLLINPGAIVDVSERLMGSDFYQESHRWVYEAACELYEQHADVDFVTVADRLQDKEQLAQVGGAAYLTKLLNETPTSMHAASYADQLHKLGVLRRLIQSAAQIAKLAYNGRSSELAEVLDKAQRLIDAATPDAKDDAVLLWLDSLEQLLETQVERAQQLDAQERGIASPIIRFPWSSLSRFNLRLRPGTLAIAAAGSSIGKTTFLECCAEHWARQGFRVVFFHLELSHHMMMDRRLSRLSGLTLQQIEDGAMGQQVDDAYKQMRAYSGGIDYVHCPGWTATRIASKARAFYARRLCDVVIVDYLQKLTLGYRPGQNKADALGDAAETLKILGEQLGIPVLLASQFNRAAGFADRKTGEYIRGSGEPHEKANVVLTLDREILNSPAFDSYGKVIAGIGERSPTMIVRVDKNTGGATGDTQLVMNAARFLILDEARGTEPINL